MSMDPERGRNTSRKNENLCGTHEHEKQSRGEDIRKKRTAAKVALIVLAAVFALLVIALVAFLIFSKAPDADNDGLLVQTTATPEASSDVTSATASPKPSASPSMSSRKEDVYTLLVVGRDKVGMNTDTIMVVSMDCKAHTANVVNIPRDTLVNVPWAVKKVNSVYGTLAIDGLVSEVQNLVGFPIDNYVVINTYVFQSVIDCIGGVWFDVPIYMYYDDPDQDLHISLSPGYQLLDGNHAEQVVRFRQNNDGTGYGTGDLGRIETQQKFFKAMAEQLLSLGNISNLPQLIDIVVSNTDTDLTSANLAFYAEEFLKLYGDGINFYTMPHENVYIRGGSYVSILLDEWLDMINAYLNPYTSKVTQANVDILTWTDAGVSSTTGSAPGIDSFYDYNG